MTDGDFKIVFIAVILGGLTIGFALGQMWSR